MSRWLNFLSVCLVTTARADASPPPESTVKPILWLPGTVGLTLVFEETRSTTEGKTTRRITTTVVSVHQSDSFVAVAIKEEKPPLKSKIVLRDTVENLLSETKLYQQTRDGVFLMMCDLDILDPPSCVMRLPPKAGDAWTNKGPAVFPDMRYTTGKEEEVEVPAGKFQTVRVELKSVLKDGRAIRITYWNAPDMGVVKSRAVLYDGTEVLLVLKSFTPSKK